MRLTTEHHETLAAPSVIAFCDTSSPCVGVQHPSFPALFYLDIRADEPSGHTSFFNGYVSKEVAALVKAAPDLLAFAQKVASECADCEGRGSRTITTYPGGIEVDNDDQPCDGCADVRAVIDRATQVRA